MPDSGGPGYEGVQSLDWPDDIFWKPDGARRRRAGLVPARIRLPAPSRACWTARCGSSPPAGLAIPWLSCFGNHEALNQGVGVTTPASPSALAGDRKPLALPDEFDHDRALELFTEQPGGVHGRPGPQPSPPIPAAGRSPGRSSSRPISGRVRARCGHGFTERNRLDGTAYYVHDTPAVRLIALDTNCLAGGAAGCLDHDQARWLEARLAEVHSVYRGRGRA